MKLIKHDDWTNTYGLSVEMVYTITRMWHRKKEEKTYIKVATGVCCCGTIRPAVGKIGKSIEKYFLTTGSSLHYSYCSLDYETGWIDIEQFETEDDGQREDESQQVSEFDAQTQTTSGESDPG